MTILAHKIRLYPNKKQETLFKKSCGVARFAYNWALDQREKQYKAGGKPTKGGIAKQLNSIKGTEFPWMYDVSKTVPQYALENLEIAYKGFFTKKSKYPKRKRKVVEIALELMTGLPNKTLMPSKSLKTK